MVARKPYAESSRYADHTPAQRAMLAWRRGLTNALRRTVAWWRRLIDLATGDNRSITSRTWIARSRVIALGLAALALGAGLTIALAPATVTRDAAIVAAVEGLVWAGMRWVLMRLLGKGVSRERRALLGAWSLGLVPYAVAFTGTLRVIAWTISAGLTWYALRTQGDDRREAGRTVGIAWGAQAVVVTLSWLARIGVIALLASRG